MRDLDSAVVREVSVNEQRIITLTCHIYLGSSRSDLHVFMVHPVDSHHHRYCIYLLLCFRHLGSNLRAWYV